MNATMRRKNSELYPVTERAKLVLSVKGRSSAPMDVYADESNSSRNAAEILLALEDEDCMADHKIVRCVGKNKIYNVDDGKFYKIDSIHLWRDRIARLDINKSILLGFEDERTQIISIETARELHAKLGELINA